MAIKLQIFTIKKFPKEDSNLTCLTVISFNSVLKKDGNYYPQVFLKAFKYIKKKVTRHIIEDLESSSDDSDDSDKEYIKAVKLMFLEKTILKMQFPKMYFLRE